MIHDTEIAKYLNIATLHMPKLIRTLCGFFLTNAHSNNNLFQVDDTCILNHLHERKPKEIEEESLLVCACMGIIILTRTIIASMGDRERA